MVELIAHRAGNSTATIEEARARADLIEFDIHYSSGSLLVTHAKRLWPTDRRWDRWYLLPSTTVTPSLESLLPVVGDDVGLWFDLKGVSRRLGPAALAAVSGARQTTVSSKSWWILAMVAGRPHVRVIRSAGNRFELWLLRRMRSRVPLDGVVLHSRLLTEDLVSELRERYGLVFTWSIPDVATATRLVEWGVDGLIIDGPELLDELIELGLAGSSFGTS